MIDVNSLVRENIKNLQPYSSARGNNLSGILLDANENPFGSDCDNCSQLNRYPDPNQLELRNQIGKYLNLKKENIFVGVGSDEIIDLLIRIFCSPGEDEALIFEPTYGMYEVACRINDIKVNSLKLTENFQIDVEQFGLIDKQKIKIIFLCSPNNPTGNLIKTSAIKNICQTTNAIVVLDEAYIDFCEDKSLINLIEESPNLVVLRTFSKAWGLAGIRCGYCAADPKIIDLLFKIKSPYNINRLTEQAVLKALANFNKKNYLIKIILYEREFLINELNKIDKVEKVCNTDSNFILFKINNASQICKRLNERGVVIRDRSTQKNLDNCLRISVGTRKENEKFIEELKRVV